jgi:hypothetical protein
MASLEEKLQQAQELFHGKNGGPEGESHIVDSNLDRKSGNFVMVWSSTKDVAKIIERCGPDVIDCNLTENGVFLKINRKAFRGIHCAFRNSKG